MVHSSSYRRRWLRGRSHPINAAEHIKVSRNESLDQIDGTPKYKGCTSSGCTLDTDNNPIAVA